MIRTGELGRVAIEKPTRFPSLSDAKRHADERIRKLDIPGLIVEVSGRKGPVKYRAHRDQSEKVTETPIV
jgi:hypothetical protein